MAEYEEQCAQLGPLVPVALGLIEYATTLMPNSRFLRKGNRWVCPMLR